MFKKLLVTVLCMMGLSTNDLIANNSYQSVDTPVSQSVKLLKRDERRDYPITIVLRRTGCAFCAKDRKTIVPRVKAMRIEGQIVYVFDVKQMSSSQLKYIKSNFKGVLYHNKIPTPTVFVAMPRKNHHSWKITEKCNNGDLTQIKKLLN